MAELNAVLYLVSKYFISSSGDRTHNQVLHFVTLRNDWPQKKKE